MHAQGEWCTSRPCLHITALNASLAYLVRQPLQVRLCNACSNICSLSSVLRRTAFCIPCSCSTVRIAAAPSTELSNTHPAEHKLTMVASPACKAHSQLATHPSNVTTTGILAIQVLLIVYNTCLLQGGCGCCSSSTSRWRLPATFEAGTAGTSFVPAGTHTKSIFCQPSSCRTAVPSAVLLRMNLKPPSASASRDMM